MFIFARKSTIMKNIGTIIFTLLLLLLPASLNAAGQFVSFKSGDLKLNNNGKVHIHVDANDCKGVAIAAANQPVYTVTTTEDKQCFAVVSKSNGTVTQHCVNGDNQVLYVD